MIFLFQGYILSFHVTIFRGVEGSWNIDIDNFTNF